MDSTGTTARPRIVVGVDGSPESKAALRWAHRLAGPLGSEIEAVIAWHHPNMLGWAVDSTEYDPSTEATKALADAVTDALGTTAAGYVHQSVVHGLPVDVLRRRSAEAAMIVVGSRGHGGFTGLLLGSVSATIAEHAQCPVLVVHGAVAVDEPTLVASASTVPA